MLSTTWSRPSARRHQRAATNAILYGSCNLQPVKVTIGVQGGWIEATIRDQGRPHPALLL
jgi:anti-sigma regulatory factor (Ser/Thr protein kinase)